MSLIKRVLGLIKPEQRSDPSWDAVALLGNGRTGQAQSISAVYACVSAISETIGSLPLHLYRETADGDRVRASDHPLYDVLQYQANPLQTAMEFREMMQAAVLLRGNAYAEIIRDGAGQVIALEPLQQITVLELDSGRLAYDVTQRGKIRRLLQEEVFHLRHRSENGKTGISPLTASRETIELALVERDHGTATFANGAKLSGILKFPQQLKKEQRDSLKASWDTQHAGAANAGRTAILDNGVEYQTVSMSMEDSEYLASRQFSVEEIARLFRVPPTVIGDLRHGNYSNSVEMNRAFVTHTLRRHLVCWEQAISTQLLTSAARKQLFAEHSVEGLLRGDSTNRADFYDKGIDAGWLLRSEARRLENLPAVKGIDDAKPNQAT
ncbi:phage portal protein [Herbaspirillum autotrophicum]|uniref:phage portal protein n=1 Tax=Herbaspirillum autotrophicum TaxID=180195 RepID=UPI00067DF5FF|nr:phage portal protein [Herbaspirillum autotrophicum]